MRWIRAAPNEQENGSGSLQAVPAALSLPRYRADIDGLRAVAVLAVVGFHAVPQWVPGGFAGVDIFFVISGFLISTILFENLHNGTFSFAEFYARRVRRIFPALAIVMAACLAFGWFALLANEYEQLGSHTAAGAGFLANVVLWSEAGYFDNEAATKPLQHLWSLGVEEQFYIVWPPLLWVAWRWKTGLLAVTLGLLAVSFALNIGGIRFDRIATFYWPLTRFWELLVGGLLAWLTVHRTALLARVERRFGNVLSISGAITLCAGVALIHPGLEFPGWWALFPVAGAGLLILAGAQGWINREVLSNRMLVWFGLISYPLYLWHWPLLSFAGIVQGESPGPVTRAAVVLVAILLSWLTWQVIEKPLRRGALGWERTLSLAAPMLAVGLAGYLISANEGLRYRRHAAIAGADEGDIGHRDFHRYIARRFHPCVPRQIADGSPTWAGHVRCAQSKAGAEIDVAVVGDSHAEHLFIGLAEALPAKNVAYYIRDTHRPFMGDAEFATIYQHVMESRSIRKVILTMYWERTVHRRPIGFSIERDILATADALIRSGKEIYLTDDVPAFPFGPKKCNGKRWPHTETRQRCQANDFQAAKVPSPGQTQLQEVVGKDSRIKLLHTRQYFCKAGLCSMIIDDKLLYRDSAHLNIQGSRYVGHRLVHDHPELAR